ncbi:MAG: hypothetical protein GY806_02735, partial [Gammaproteobacteria bacterium]|nr:hypothetical protein [Gammaproteobacteria bacterium]
LDQANDFDQISIATASNATIDNGSNDLRLNQLVVDNELRLDADSLIDNNGNDTNLQVDRLTIRTVSGIGINNALETRVALMDVINTGAGDIDIAFIQQGDVEFVALQNSNSIGTIKIDSDSDYYFNPGSVDANRLQGTLTMTTSGDFFGVGNANLNNADIRAFSATFFSPGGTFGTPVRPIILDVPTQGNVLIQTTTTSAGYFPETPDDLISDGIDIGILGNISAIAGDQLVEIESLSEVDPAIFTALRNFSLEEISIHMPRDQRYDDEFEDEGVIN